MFCSRITASTMELIMISRTGFSDPTVTALMMFAVMIGMIQIGEFLRMYNSSPKINPPVFFLRRRL